jgi:hypothetical protein
MIWSKNREYLQIQAGDLELFGWEYKAMIDVFYLYLLAMIFGISTGAFIVIINKKGQNRRKKKSKEIEEIVKIPRGGDTPDPDSETNSSKGKEEFYKLLYRMVYNETETGNCLQKREVSKVMDKKTARKLYDSLKTSLQKKSIPIVVTGFRQFLELYQLKKKAKGLLFALILNSVNLSLQKRYCENFIAPVADTSIEFVTQKPDTILLPDSSNSIYVLSSSSSLKLVLKDTPQCKLHVEDVLANYRTSNGKDFQNYLENQNKKCEKNQIVEIEPLSLKDFDIKTFKGTIHSEYWEIFQKEAENEEKKVNKMFLDSSVEVVNDFPKPKRDLNCEKEAYEKTFEGKLETILGDLEEPSEMPIPIQTECSQNKINRKSKSVPLKKRTKTLADLKDETSTIPKMFEPKEAFRIPNENQK